MSDPVNKPSHYNAGEVETIDGIRAALGEGFADYCRGNVLKYVWRCGKKGDGVEDLKKAATYLQWAIEAMEGNCPVIPDSSNSKPIAIPGGWRELEPDEVPLATDMHEWMGGWFFRNNDATHEYKWHDIRHIRKIEPSNPSETPNSSIPNPGEGYRLLSKEPSEPVWEGDEFWRTFDCKWIESKNWKHEGGLQAPSYYYRRKIEQLPAEWIPKVGDKVRVKCATPFPKEDRFGVVVKDNVRPREDLFLIKTSNGIFSWFYTSELKLIEAAP
jgi:hypothetical protein